MALSQITITFNQDIPANGNIEISYSTTSPIGLGFITEYFKNVRSQPYETLVGVPTATPGEISAFNFVNAFNLDYNNSNQYDISRIGKVVTIKSLNYHFSFTQGEAYLDNVGNPANVAFIISNYTGVNFIIDSVNFSAADANKCSRIKINIAASEPIAQILQPINQLVSPANANISFEVNRNQNTTVRIKNAAGAQVNSSSIQVPSFLDIATRNVIIDPAATGTNVTIYLNVYLLNLEYSLDNVTWQTSNSFTGLLAGNYTVYVRDQFGCSDSFPLVILANDIYLPFFKISKSNSIRFANRITFGDAANYRNDENTLSCEVNVPLPYKEVQLFQTADIITTQFKSNYSINSAKVVRFDSTEIDVPVIQKSANIGLKDSQDGILFDLDFGKSGIYFISGNSYDYNTGIENGTYILNGGIPKWAVAGNYVRIGVQFYLIEDVIFDDDKNSDVIVISYLYSSANPETNLIISCRYNSFNYEVYEFVIDMVDYINEDIRVQILATDSNFENLTLLSEQINVKVKHDFTVDINYWNEDNTDVFYQTGIRHRIRIPFTKQSASDTDASENYQTDTNTVLLSAEIYEVEEFIFEPMTKELHRKVKQALSHKFITIDGIYYVKNGSFDVDGPLEESNLYVIKVKMIKSGSPFNNEKTSTFDFDNGLNVIPGLIKTDTGFLKY